jgi:RNase H-fold protein (predicted Holliday junction resolvase)
LNGEQTTIKKMNEAIIANLKSMTRVQLQGVDKRLQTISAKKLI